MSIESSLTLGFIGNLFFYALISKYWFKCFHYVYYSITTNKSKMVPIVRLELTTYWLQISCSTSWAKSALVVALGNAPSESEDNRFTVCFASLTRYATFGLSGWIWTNNLVNPNHAPCQIEPQIELANRIGFEPMKVCFNFDELATRCFQPLSHLFWLRGKELHLLPSAYETDKLLLLYPTIGGGRRIWTFGPFLDNSFQDYHDKPLWHPSVAG